MDDIFDAVERTAGTEPNAAGVVPGS